MSGRRSARRLRGRAARLLPADRARPGHPRRRRRARRRTGRRAGADADGAVRPARRSRRGRSRGGSRARPAACCLRTPRWTNSASFDGELLRLGPMALPPPPRGVRRPGRRAGGAHRVRRGARSAATGRGRPGRRRPGRCTGCSAEPATGPPRTPGAVALGGLGATAAVVRAAQLGRDTAARESGASRTAALVPALCAVPPAAAAGWVAAPGPSDVARLLLAVVAAGTAAALAQVAVRTARSALIGIVLAAVLTATAAVARLWFDVPTHAIAALTAAVVVSAVPLLPRLTLRLAGLPRPAVPTDATDLVAADSGPDLLPPAELAARARLARAVLAGLSGGCAVVAAVAAPVAAADGRSGWAGPVLARGRRGGAAPARPRVRRSTDGLGAPRRRHGDRNGPGRIGRAHHRSGRPTGRRTRPARGRGGGRRRGRPGTGRDTSPVLRRAVDITEGLLTVAAVPLALAAAGVFALVRGL